MSNSEMPNSEMSNSEMSSSSDSLKGDADTLIAKTKKFYSAAPVFVLKYFTKVDDGDHLRCNLCWDAGKTLKYSLRTQIYRNPVRHLFKMHGIVHKKAARRKEFIDSIIDD